MKKSFLHYAALGLISGALLLTTTTNAAEDKTPGKPAAEKSSDTKSEKKPRAIPFRGKVAAVDKSAATLTVGERVFHVSAQTKLTKQGKTAGLSEAVVGETVTGSYLKAEDGKLNAVSVRLSPVPKSDESGGGQKKKQLPSDDSKGKAPKAK